MGLFAVGVPDTVNRHTDVERNATVCLSMTSGGGVHSACCVGACSEQLANGETGRPR